ncbi:MAG: Z1 domain-containing protein, partial [Bacilli bacterium]
MAVNHEIVSNHVRFIDAMIQIKKLGSHLNEETVDELIVAATSFLNNDLETENLEAIKRDITWRYKIYSTPGESLIANYEQNNWYDEAKELLTPVFWSRYRNFLIDKKNFSPNIVSTLGEDTLDAKLMNYIGNPKAEAGFLKRGLIIGDVQSGKTSTYIGLICKAADAGYKVFILLTGTIESLRKQTQERVEEGFIGINMSADTTGGQRVGVGLDNMPIHAMALTSRKSDFTANSDKIAVSLGDKEAVVFVIKKQTSVLKKLKEWLVSLNADPITQKIDMPMLLIDDEADNASINTNADKENPTKINKLIRDLANVFTKANYVGFTATPFANVFIDPETSDLMKTEDLFPEDFIVALPTPSNYIGPDRVFGRNGEYSEQLIYIKDAGRDELDGFEFYFKHKKEWDGELPESLTDSIYTFYLANAIRDLRGDKKEHRSMMINISRFVMVQKHIKMIVEEIHSNAYRSIKYNLSNNFNESMKDPIIKNIYNCWLEQYSDKTEFKWADIVKYLFNSIE